jgi:hypothetical protein
MIQSPATQARAVRFSLSLAHFEVARIGSVCPEGAKHKSPGQSEVALRHERRPGKRNTDNPKALKGRNNLFVSPFQGFRVDGI